MRNKFLHFLGVEPGEESMVSLLLAQSVFLGLFYGAFDISAHSLFLAVFDETIMARAYVVSGLSGILLTSLYSYIQARMKFKNFAVLNLSFITILTLLLWVLLITFPVKGIIFAVFVMMGPLNILAMLGFWGTTGRLFSLRQGKRLFGLVDTGQVIGIIVSSYTIPVLLAFGFKTHNIILLSALAIFGAAWLQISLSTTNSLKDTGSVRKGSVKTALSMFRKEAYVLNMGLFIAVSVMTAFFIQYSFMAVTREQYPLEADMAKFLGLFTGSMMIFTLFLKTFLFSYLIRTYGLRIILLLSPLLLVVFTAVAAGIGSTMGYTPGTGGFIIFFLLLALSRLFSKALKDSVETPSFKVIYQTLDERVRYDVQSIVDGTVNEIAALTSGLLLSGLGLIVLGNLIHFSWVLLFITVIWVYIGYRLYSEYRRAIVRSLEESATVSRKTSDQLSELSDKGYFHTAIVVRRNYLQIIKKEFDLPESGYNEEFIKSMRPDNAGAREMLELNRSPQVSVLLRLLRNNSIDSKRAALLAIGKFRITEMISEVCDSIGKPGVSVEAVSVLDSFGPEASAELNRSFLKNSGNIIISRQILEIIGRNCFKGSEGMVFQMLWASSRNIKEKAADILLKNDYQVAPGERDKVHQLISDVVGIIVWHSGVSLVLKKSGDSALSKALENEKAWWTGFLFKLLAITYDRNYIEKIRENLETATLESVNFALEMIDIVLDESIKTKVSYSVDITPDEEKLRLLHQFYPIHISGYNDLIAEIINRDYNLTGLWTKAMAVGEIKNSNERDFFEMTLLSLLFSPERILSEEAARVVLGWDHWDVAPVLKRLPPENRSVVTEVLSGAIAEPEFMVSKVNFLRSILPAIGEHSLISLAANIKLVDGGTIKSSFPGDTFIWDASSSLSTPEGFFIRAGKTFSQTEIHSDSYYSLTSDDLSNYLSSNDNYLNEITRLTDKIELKS